MADLIYLATLDTKQVLTALKNIDANIDKMAKSADKSFQQVGKSAQASGVQIGVISGITQEITRRIIDLGQKAIAAFSSMTQEAVGLASELQTTEAIFTGVFQGNESAAVGALQHIREESRGLGIDLQEVSRAFLPFVGSLEELDRVNKIAAALAISQPEQGPLGARIALQEALSGNVQSLVRRFEIPKTLGKELQRALDEGGTREFLTTFESIMKKLGRDVEQLTDTFQFSFAKAAESGRQLQASFGIPIVDELKRQFDDLNDTLSENFDDYTLIADTFGRVFANIVDIIGSDINSFLANLDTEQVTRIAEKFFDIVEHARVLAETLAKTALSGDLITNIEKLANKLDEALVTATQLNALSQAGAAKAKAEFQAYADEIERLHGEGTIATGVLKELVGIPGVVQTTNQLAKLIGDERAQVVVAQSAAAGQEAYNKVLLDAANALEGARKKSEENRDATDRLRESIAKGTEAEKDLADAQIRRQKAQDDLANLTEDYEAAQDKVNEKLADAEKDLQRQLEDIDIETERKRLDIQIEFAQNREDAARDNLEKLADIEKKNGQDIADAATDLSRKEEDIARKFADDRIDIERETRQKRVDIESDFRRKLQDIQTQFLLDADEAEQKRDAVGFLRALKRRDEEVRQAQQDRERTIQDTRVEEERKREELRIAQAREIEEARIANERKLEDLRLNLERQIEAQNTAYARQLDDLTIQEQRKNEELTRSRERDIEDAQRAYDRKLEDLKVSLEGEYKAIEEYETKKQDLLRQSWEAQYEIQKAGLDKMRSLLSADALNAPVPAGTSHGPSGNKPGIKKPGTGQAQGAHPGAIPGFQSGGGFTVGGSGGIDSQLVRFLASPGERVTISPPGSPVLMPTFGGGLGGSISNSRETNVNLPLATPEQIMNPILMAQIRNMILQTIANVN